MRREERFQQILDLLGKEGFITVEGLSKRFYISLPTAYRDLRELERQRLVIRGDGGAMLVAPEKANLPVDYRVSVNAEAKAAIGKRAAELLEPGDVIFIDASTTVAAMIEHMKPDMDLTVLTNGLVTAIRLRASGLRTFCVGGNLIDNSIAVGGRLAGDVVDHFKIDKMFFSAYGVNDMGEIIDTSEMESSLRRLILRKPAVSVFLCDQSKFGKQSVFRITSLENLDYVISDAPLPEHYPRPRREAIMASQPEICL